MKALVLESKQEGFVYREVSEPKEEIGKEIVDVKYAALNRRDFWIKEGKYAGIKYPCILGSDGMGYSKDGTRVLICPSIGWESEPVQPYGYKILGLPDKGTFAQKIQVESKYVFPVPSHLTDEEAAALPLAGLTAYRALFEMGKCSSTSKVLINGIGGGVSTMAFLFAKAVGAQVYVTSSSKEKISQAIELGALGGVQYTKDNWSNDFLNDFDHIDLVIDGSAGSSWSDLVNVLSPGGMLVNYGGTAGTINQLSPRDIFWKQITIQGTTMGSREDFKSMLDFVAENNIRPIIDSVYSIDAVQSAFYKMKESSQFGKLVFNIN